MRIKAVNTMRKRERKYGQSPGFRILTAGRRNLLKRRKTMHGKSVLQNIFIGLNFFCLAAFAVSAQTTGFTYQGKLSDGGVPANGNYEMRFTLFDQAKGGFEIGTPKIIPNVAVANGIFTVKLEVGDWIFDNGDRFMEIAVRPQAS